MNCRDCELLLVEAARGARAARVLWPAPGESGSPRSLGVAAGAGSDANVDLAEALEHAASCPACAERLREERALTTELRALAAVEASREPTSGCEATLLAAYRAERGREVHTRRWLFALSTAMVASLVVLLGTALLLSRESSTLVRSMVSRLSPLAAHPEASGRTAAEQRSSEAENAASEQEEVTEFVAFYPGADVGVLDPAALVRVRMPSSALGSFGLPVAQGSEDEWVSADLLVAEDGSPQAIRLVRPVSKSSRN